eukprot:CAMPEP_0206136786 /NCGR_PEP_ID=MMETSP1473-20131121/2014_1 /ASSEMBLY_ACC=CAM_ASM_001109 /TAXON_ID=1461547 /ORGANISM="Stichococcus sp, Strain RCC1054" /LENGTH=1674 /DNA_ID=CAMNT_0053529559 /DNA_START=82 /DNA_END=5106 /DNA_ORIENTATION=+
MATAGGGDHPGSTHHQREDALDAADRTTFGLPSTSMSPTQEATGVVSGEPVKQLPPMQPMPPMGEGRTLPINTTSSQMKQTSEAMTKVQEVLAHAQDVLVSPIPPPTPPVAPFAPTPPAPPATPIAPEPPLLPTDIAPPPAPPVPPFASGTTNRPAYPPDPSAAAHAGLPGGMPGGMHGTTSAVTNEAFLAPPVPLPYKSPPVEDPPLSPPSTEAVPRSSEPEEDTSLQQRTGGAKWEPPSIAAPTSGSISGAPLFGSAAPRREGASFMPPSGGPAQPTTNPETSGTLESRTMPSIVHPGATPDAGNNTFSSDGFSTAATDGSATVGTLPSGTGVHATPPASRTAAAVPGAMQHARSGDSLAVQHGSEAGGSPPASAPSPLSAGMRPTPASTGGITGTRAFPSSMGGTTGKAGALPAYLLVSGAPVGAGGGADLDAPSIPSVSSEAMAPPPTEAVPPPTGAFAAKAAQVDVPRADTIGDTKVAEDAKAIDRNAQEVQAGRVDINNGLAPAGFQASGRRRSGQAKTSRSFGGPPDPSIADAVNRAFGGLSQPAQAQTQTIPNIPDAPSAVGQDVTRNQNDPLEPSPAAPTAAGQVLPLQQDSPLEASSTPAQPSHTQTQSPQAAPVAVTVLGPQDATAAATASTAEAAVAAAPAAATLDRQPQNTEPLSQTVPVPAAAFPNADSSLTATGMETPPVPEPTSAAATGPAAAMPAPAGTPAAPFSAVAAVATLLQSTPSEAEPILPPGSTALHGTPSEVEPLLPPEGDSSTAAATTAPVAGSDAEDSPSTLQGTTTTGGTTTAAYAADTMKSGAAAAADAARAAAGSVTAAAAAAADLFKSQGDTPTPSLTKEGSVGVVASTASAAARAVTDAANTAVDTVRTTAADAADTLKTTVDENFTRQEDTSSTERAAEGERNQSKSIASEPASLELGSVDLDGQANVSGALSQLDFARSASEPPKKAKISHTNVVAPSKQLSTPPADDLKAADDFLAADKPGILGSSAQQGSAAGNPAVAMLIAPEISTSAAPEDTATSALPVALSGSAHPAAATDRGYDPHGAGDEPSAAATKVDYTSLTTGDETRDPITAATSTAGSHPADVSARSYDPYGAKDDPPADATTVDYAPLGSSGAQDGPAAPASSAASTAGSARSGAPPAHGYDPQGSQDDPSADTTNVNYANLTADETQQPTAAPEVTTTTAATTPSDGSTRESEFASEADTSYVPEGVKAPAAAAAGAMVNAAAAASRAMHDATLSASDTIMSKSKEGVEQEGGAGPESTASNTALDEPALGATQTDGGRGDTAYPPGTVQDAAARGGGTWQETAAQLPATAQQAAASAVQTIKSTAGSLASKVQGASPSEGMRDGTQPSGADQPGTATSFDKLATLPQVYEDAAIAGGSASRNTADSLTAVSRGEGPQGDSSTADQLGGGTVAYAADTVKSGAAAAADAARAVAGSATTAAAAAADAIRSKVVGDDSEYEEVTDEVPQISGSSVTERMHGSVPPDSTAEDARGAAAASAATPGGKKKAVGSVMQPTTPPPTPTARAANTPAGVPTGSTAGAKDGDGTEGDKARLSRASMDEAITRAGAVADEAAAAAEEIAEEACAPIDETEGVGRGERPTASVVDARAEENREWLSDLIRTMVAWIRAALTGTASAALDVLVRLRGMLAYRAVPQEE